MKELLLCIASATILWSCSSEVIRINENEKIFDSRINNAESDGSYVLMAKASPMLDTLGAPVAAGALAVTNFNNLSEENQKTHKKTTVQIEQTNEEKKTYDFSNEVMMQLKEKDDAFQNFTEAFVDGDLDRLTALSSKEFITEGNIAVLKTELDLMEDEFGNLQSYRLIGVGVLTDEIGKVIQMQGQLRFENQDIFYVVAYDAPIGKDKFVAYKFSF